MLTGDNQSEAELITQYSVAVERADESTSRTTSSETGTVQLLSSPAIVPIPVGSANRNDWFRVFLS
jgi:hypothetical protein